MKKYFVLFAEIGLVIVLLWAFGAKKWLIFGHPLSLGAPLPPGEYLAIFPSSLPQEILLISKTTNTVKVSPQEGMVFFSLATNSLVSSPEKALVYPKKTWCVHSMVIGVGILCLIIGLYLFKHSQNLPWHMRYFLLALGFGWSGTFAVIFLMLSVLFGLSSGWKTYRFRWCHLLVGGFLGWAMISGALSRFPLNGVGAGLLFAVYMLVGFSFQGETWKNLPWKLIGKSLLLAFVTAGIVGLFQQWYIKQGIGIWASTSWALLWPYHQQELVSLFEWAARGGYWLGLMIPVLFTVFLQETERRNKILWGSGVILGLFLLMFTQSRGGFVLAFVGMFSQLLFLRKGYLALFLLLLPLGLFVVAPDSKWAQSLKNPFSFHTNIQRLHQLRAGIDFWKGANPLTGIGLMNFREYYYEKRHTYDIYSMADYLHQGYFAILLETGIIGWILLYGFLFSVWLKVFLSLLKKKHSSFSLVWGILNGMWVTLVFDAMLLYAFYLGMWVWMWIGVGTRLIEEETVKGQSI
ncbi:MAG: O-antigen ligase family protein [Brevinematales bacterium]|nr:O-antigen ligase family protein [Brevinematales bacterium]